MSASIERIEALFCQAIEFRPDERAAFLAGACGQDSALLSRVLALLRAHEADEAILPAQPRNESAGALIAEKPGDRMGHYKLLEQIGEGGFGVVYMAEQEEPVRRRVALKVIKLGMDTKKVVARFEAERQALALMDHPNIAKVFDAGTTLNGRPYFVMELVRGVKITDYCDRNRLSTAQRLDLFMQTCRAVQHAHQKGIIHRDLKPSNVLVTVHDGEPVPKVIDFGIAKATEGRLTDQTLFTAFEQFIGTPAYMSPEQAELKGLDVDTRTDIYSLGVLLYELLTGKTPFDAKELLSAGLDEMRRTIREKEPPRPSTRLTMELAKAESATRERLASAPEAKLDHRQAELDATSSHRPLQTKELIHLLRGDLDWIVMKCLEKDRTRRYETANGLAMDLQRHLNSEPVSARPPSNLYRFQKLVRRNRLTFAAAVAVALALVLGTVASTLEAIRAWKAERTQSWLRVEADRARGGEAEQRASAEQHLYDALLGEARAKQLSGRAGQRFESLEAISKAATLRKSRDLSDAAVAAFALPDVHEQKRWHFPGHWVAENVCFDDSFGLYAYRTLSGISVRRMHNDEEMAFLPVADVENIANQLLYLRFDRRSHYFAAFCSTRDAGLRCRVWDLTRAGALALDTAAVGFSDFSPDGQSLAVATPNNTIVIQEIGSGRELKQLPVEARVELIRFSPDGLSLAGLALGSSNVCIWDLATAQMAVTLPNSGKPTFLAWNDNGTLLAVGQQDGKIATWNPQSGRLLTRMEGHETRVTALAFSHHGDLLASAAWDSTLRLWDVAGGQQLMVYRTQDTELRFSPDDRVLAYAAEGEFTKLFEVASATGFTRLADGVGPKRSSSEDFSPDGRLLAVATSTGIAIWDVVARKGLGLIPASDCRSVYFQTNGGLSIIGSTAEGLYRWGLHRESVAGVSFLRVEPPKPLGPLQAYRNAAVDRGATKILVSRPNLVDPAVLDLTNPTNLLKLRSRGGAGFVALSPSGRWAATGTWKGSGVSVCDASTGQLIRELPIRGTACVAFSPDEAWLATSDMTEARLWKTGSWEPRLQSLPGDGVSEINPLVFSPDGRLLALVHGACEVEVVSVPSCEVVATLRTPSLSRLSSLRFSPDGATLAGLEWSGPVDLWDLRVTRGELKKLNLDWAIPPFAAAEDTMTTEPIGLLFDVGPFSKEELARAIPPREAKTPGYLIDLTGLYNAPLTESWHSPKAVHNDLSELPWGMHKFSGVEFDARGLIQIGTPADNGLAYPNHLLDIPIRRQCRRMHFLHGAIYAAGARSGDELGAYIFHYADGRQVELPLVAGKDLGEWWSQPNEQNLTFNIGWTGNNPSAMSNGHTIRLFRSSWENPFPDVAIRQMDFVSHKPTSGQPFLVAITAEP